MKTLSAVIVTAALTLGADAPPDAVKQELAKLQGTWQLVSAETDGQKAPEERVQQTRVVIAGSKHTVYFGADAVAKDVPFTLDPTKSPKATDDTLSDGQVVRGIYKLDGDILTSCVAQAGKDRPTEFTAQAGSGQMLRVFRRAK